MIHPRLVAPVALLTALLAVGRTAPADDILAAAEVAEKDPGPTSEQLEAWRVGLDAPVYAERERASDALLAAGRVAVPYLRQAVHGESLEAADRAVWILQQLADTNDELVQMVVLEVLVSADRFPAIARQSDIALAELNAKMCSDRLKDLGAEFIDRPDRVYTTTINIKVNTNREEWAGEVADLLLLTKLRRVGKLTIASQLVDDQTVAQLAAIDGLSSLTLIETNVSSDAVRKLKTQYPELRLIVHTRAKLGVRFFEGQPLNVTEVLPNSPAHRAGMRAGDHVVEFDGQPVTSFDGLTALIAEHKPGKDVEITVERGDETLTLTAQLGGTDWWEELKDD